MNSSAEKLLPSLFLLRFPPRKFGNLLASSRMRCQPPPREPSAVLAVSLFPVQMHKIGDSSRSIDCLRGCLDICGRHDDVWQFCSPCHSALRGGGVPKLSAKNSINVTMCQHYPSALEGLTAVEESLIAKCHPVGTILKLRPGGRSSPVAYNALRGHMIVIPQDPGPLLDILPSPDLKLNDIIKVIWLGKLAPAV